MCISSVRESFIMNCVCFRCCSWDLRNPGRVLLTMNRTVETNQRVYFDLHPTGRYLITGLFINSYFFTHKTFPFFPAPLIKQHFFCYNRRHERFGRNLGRTERDGNERRQWKWRSFDWRNGEVASQRRLHQRCRVSRAEPQMLRLSLLHLFHFISIFWALKYTFVGKIQGVCYSGLRFSCNSCSGFHVDQKASIW